MENWTESQAIEFFESNNYFCVRRFPDGSYAGLYKLMYTTAICSGLNEYGYEYRFCYEDPLLAFAQLMLMQNYDDVPDGWVARR
jgi:hypothetical protein